MWIDVVDICVCRRVSLKSMTLFLYTLSIRYTECYYKGHQNEKNILTIASCSPHLYIMYKTKAHFIKLLILTHQSEKNFWSFRKCFQRNSTAILYWKSTAPMQVRDQDQASAGLATETKMVARRIGGWVSLRAGPES